MIKLYYLLKNISIIFKYHIFMVEKSDKFDEWMLNRQTFYAKFLALHILRAIIY